MIEKKTGSCKNLPDTADMAATDAGEVPPGRRAKSCTYRGHGDYVAQRSAAGTRNTVLYILRAWRNGRRTALRMLWIKIRGGSNPPARTKDQNALCTASIHTHYRTATLFLCHPGARPHPLSPRGPSVFILSPRCLTAGPRLINSSRSDTNRCCLC